MTPEQLERYLARIGLDGSDRSLAALQLAHVRSIAYENLDIHLGRPILLDVDSLVMKMVDRRRGGYCYEQNTLFAAALEGLGLEVTRCLGRVRLSDQVSPRPATHMVLLVDGHVVDVGFGSANPLGPIPLGGEVSYGPCTWRTERVVSPEGEEAWLVSLFEMQLYTFTETPQHPVDYVAPNHYSSTHPMSIFTWAPMVQHCTEEYLDVALFGLQLTERRPGGEVDVSTVDAESLGELLCGRFGLELTDEELERVRGACSGQKV